MLLTIPFFSYTRIKIRAGEFVPSRMWLLARCGMGNMFISM